MTTRRDAPVLANDFAAQWAEIRDDALAAVDRVGASGWLVLGQEVERFEHEIAAWWGVEHAVGVASGLDALEIALRVIGIGPGDRVLTTPLTAYATTLAILRVGAEPVWCDVDPSGGLDLDAADAALCSDNGIRAVLPVHLFGHPVSPDGLARLAAVHGVEVVEDCAQSAGARRDARPTGTAGRVAATSLYPTKNLGAMGDAGILLTSDSELADHARRLRNYGQESRYNHVEAGLNSRLDEIHAAILRSAMLPRLDGWLLRRAEIARAYEVGLQDTQLRPIVASAGSSAHHLFPVETPAGTRDDLLRELAARGVAGGVHYPFLCPDAPASRGAGVVFDGLTTARRLADRELSLPLHPHLDDAAIDRVLSVCRTLLT